MQPCTNWLDILPKRITYRFKMVLDSQWIWFRHFGIWEVERLQFSTIIDSLFQIKFKKDNIYLNFVQTGKKYHAKGETTAREPVSISKGIERATYLRVPVQLRFTSSELYLTEAEIQLKLVCMFVISQSGSIVGQSRSDYLRGKVNNLAQLRVIHLNQDQKKNFFFLIKSIRNRLRLKQSKNLNPNTSQ